MLVFGIGTINVGRPSNDGDPFCIRSMHVIDIVAKLMTGKRLLRRVRALGWYTGRWVVRSSVCCSVQCANFTSESKVIEGLN